ncbi:MULTISPECIES: YjgB family protein [Desulfitobacterium]|uniref:DUF4309 domain-containing protein n=1 Tax=Desulfitobacterium dehalogenans (strain ATCC 51507 / DSM 9161 / JW/IU-DC1) TaxID=756499 RepID=I4A846_DESDJ|nr:MULTISPECIES: YjgB family protein [Desulfitobacterium]AFM00131.1 hypothetical protein Desde_1734 [Desulfitobacterium dehalogenans ATCC 51507]
MFKLTKKVLSVFTVIALALISIVGCSAQSNPPQPNSGLQEHTPSSELQSQNKPEQTAPGSQITNPPSSSDQTDSSQALLLNIRQLAEKGKVINSDFAAKTTVIEDVEKKWGKPDSTDWVPEAKGNYATYSSHAMVFGFNKGSQIFEVRSFDKQLQKITLSKVKDIFGTPAYTATVGGEDIIGYTAGQEFKILLVFPKVTGTNSDPTLDHYSVLYPQGTVNSMANDPGRQW